MRWGRADCIRGWGAPRSGPCASAPSPNATPCQCKSCSQLAVRREKPLRQKLAQPGRQYANALLAGSASSRCGARIISTVAGQVRLSGECPVHPKGLVSLGLFAKRQSRPTISVMSSGNTRARKGYLQVDPWPSADDLQSACSVAPLRVSQLIDAGGAGGLAPKFGQRRWATCSTQCGCRCENAVSRVRKPQSTAVIRLVLRARMTASVGY